MDQVETPAPAPAEVPPAPPTAADAAVAEHDVTLFRDARRAERTGTPLPAPEPQPEPAPEPDAPELNAPKPAAVAQPAREVSKRQHEANERTRLAVERATADYRARIAELEARVTPRTEPQPAPAPTEPEYKRFRAMADAPKLDQFDSIEDHSAAMALFIADKRMDERDARSKQESARDTFVKEQQDRNTAFRSRVGEVVKTDPEFWDHLSPDVKALRPRADLGPKERPTAANDLADEILDNPNGPRLMVHLTDHPDVLDSLSSLPARSQLYVELGKLYATFEQAPQTPIIKHISDAPEPVTTLGRKAAEPADEIVAAVAAHDVTAFRAKRLQERTVTFRK